MVAFAIILFFAVTGLTLNHVDRFAGHDQVRHATGTMAILNDLHGGASTGPAWSWLIDACAILLTLVSLTGLLMLFFLAKRRIKGLLLATAGATLCFLIYLKLVP